MKRTIQVRISKGEGKFVAECLDLPVVTQATSLDEQRRVLDVGSTQPGDVPILPHVAG